MLLFRVLIVLTLLWPALAPGQVAVRVAPLEEVLVSLERRAPAQVLPLNDSVMAAEVNAVVREVAADVGAEVAAGDVLLILEETDFRLQLDAAEAALASARAREDDARAKLERARSLSDAQYVSVDELLTRQTALSVAEADIASARAQVAIARRNLDKCRVVAPFDGAVQARPAQVGAYVTVGTPLLRLVQVGATEVDAEVPEDVADGLGQAGTLRFESRGERFPLRLLRLSPVVDPERRSRRARLAFTGPSAGAGRSGEIAWTVASGQLPANLLSRRDGRLGVFLHREGRAVFVPVPGAEEGRPAPVDLARDVEVIVLGQDRLQDGDPVTVR